VGTVVIAIATDHTRRVRTFQFFGGREMVKFQSTQAAMNMLRLLLLEKSGDSARMSEPATSSRP
jgi:nicotinamide mononucleotide (NMN) deamidase PncC